MCKPVVIVIGKYIYCNLWYKYYVDYSNVFQVFLCIINININYGDEVTE